MATTRSLLLRILIKILLLLSEHGFRKKEALENIRDRLYQIEDKAHSLEPQMAKKLINWWLLKPNQATGEV